LFIPLDCLARLVARYLMGYRPPQLLISFANQNTRNLPQPQYGHARAFGGGGLPCPLSTYLYSFRCCT